MKLRQSPLLAAAVAVLAVGSAHAQSETVIATGSPGSSATPAVANITFQGVLTSALELHVVGDDDTNVTSAVPGNPATGIVNFGTFSTVNPELVETGDGYRTIAGDAGAMVVASMIATIIYNGAATGSVTIGQQNALGLLPAQVRHGSATATWNAGTDHAQVPAIATPAELCPAGNCASGTPLPHRVAIFLPDTQPDGAFSTIISYTATAL
jgi:hypothetical protein